MGVFYVQEENPFNSFLKGVAPIADAWGDRYKERHKVNIRNRAEELAKAQAPLKTREDILAEYNLKRAKPDYFSDDWPAQGKFGIDSAENILTEHKFKRARPDYFSDDWPVQKKFGINSSVDDLANAYSSSSGFGNIDQASARAAQRMIAYPNIDEILEQDNAKISADFAQNQALERAKLVKDGVGVFGYQGMQDLLNQTEQKQRLSRITADSDSMDIMKALMEEARARGDLATMAALAMYMAPNYQYNTFNTGGETVVMGVDSRKPNGMSFKSFPNTRLKP